MAWYATVVANSTIFETLCERSDALFAAYYHALDELVDHQDPNGIELGSLGACGFPPAERAWVSLSDSIGLACRGLLTFQPGKTSRARGEMFDLRAVAGRKHIAHQDPDRTVLAYGPRAMDELRPFLERWRAAVGSVPNGYFSDGEPGVRMYAARLIIDRLLETPDRVCFTLFDG